MGKSGKTSPQRELMPVAVLECCDLYAQPDIKTTPASVLEPAGPAWNLSSSICTNSDADLRSIAVPRSEHTQQQQAPPTSQGPC